MDVARRRVDETGDLVRRLAADLGEAQTEVICRVINGVFCFSCVWLRARKHETNQEKAIKTRLYSGKAKEAKEALTAAKRRQRELRGLGVEAQVRGLRRKAKEEEKAEREQREEERQKGRPRRDGYYNSAFWLCESTYGGTPEPSLRT